MLFVTYFFGVMGNYRVNASIVALHGGALPYNSEHILEISYANKRFNQSQIPGEFMWTYIYIASPIGNLQYNIDKSDPEINFYNFFRFLNNEIFYDFISKRINAILKLEPPDSFLIVDYLTVSTIYRGSYNALGWLGLIMMGFFLLVLPIFYIGILRPSSSYYLSGIVVLNTLYLFIFFDNMLIFAGTGLQLVYPILLDILCRIKIR
ncbi:MAG: hypothetical protein NW226_24940 [Microscillaceae bacterium]|nr:hypothetical protein [Microscillaceae bacterium]